MLRSVEQPFEMLPKTLVGTAQEVPQVLLALDPHDLQMLQASCTQFRTLVHAFIKKLTIRGYKPYAIADMQLLVRGGWFHLQRLVVSDLSLNDESLDVLARGDWGLLQSLSLSCNNLGVEGLRHFSPARFPALTNFELRYSRVSSHAMACIVSRWPQLESLNLSSNHLDRECIAQLAEGIWPLLTRLELNNNNIPTSAVGALQSARWPLLERLSLHGCYHKDAEAKRDDDDESQARVAAFQGLAQCKWHHLNYLNLVECKLDAACMRELCKGQWPSLSHLDLSVNCLTGDSLKHLVDSQWLQLRHLILSTCQIDLNAVTHLARGRRWPMLTTLNLTNNGIHVQALEVLLEGRWPMLATLDLSFNNLGIGLAVVLASGHRLPLQSGMNVVTPPAWLLTCWPRLQVLDLSYCRQP